MKLEPSRPTLSGRPEFLRPQAPLQTSAIVQAPRRCASCNCEDVISAVHEDGGQRVEHSVTIELRYLKKLDDCNSYLRSKGWRPRLHQARPAMERFLCRPCIVGHEIMEKEFRQKSARDRKSNVNQDGYYMAVCGE